MTPRWHWDFEDAHVPRRRPPAPPVVTEPQPAPTPVPARRPQFGRRRLAAALALGVVIALIVAALSGSGHQHAGSASAAQADLARARHARAHAPSKPENDQNGAVAATLAYTPFVREGGSRGREVALTFDDGPGPYTPEVLSVLERFHVHATFFAIGKMERYFSASTVREIEDGDVIGDHTESHPFLAQLSAHDQHEELFEQIARIELLGGPKPRLFRPPYGSFDATTFHLLHQMHLLMVLWSTDTDDYQLPGVPAIVHSALAGAHPGAIILMHDAGGDRSETIAALPAIVKGLRRKGLEPVTVPRLMLDDPPPHGQPLPTSLAGD
jgi:peptidoglycan-N-acetylglucosamine deacetylase